MKRTFTFLLTALFLCMGMTLKAEVTTESPWVGSAIENGQTYYLYNVKAKAFLKGANSWGTQASFGEDAVAFIAEGSGDTYGLKSTYNAYLGADLYVDQGKKDFVFTEVGDGMYTITKDGAYVAYDGSSVAQTAANVNDGCYWQLLTAESIKQQMEEKAGAATPYAATPLIAGANFGRNDGANSAWGGGPDLGGDNDNFCAEKWNAGISSVTQTLTDLPNGTYKLQAQGLYRMGGVDGAVAHRDAGTEIYDVNFIANDSKVLVMSVMDEAGKLNGVGDNYGTYGAAPNNRNHASKFFNAGYYEHEVYFTVTDGTAVIGVANNTGEGSDWLVFDNFRLTYYGTATVAEIEQVKLGEFFTAVEDLVAAAEAIEATYSEGAKAELDAAIAAGKAAMGALTEEALVAAVAPLQAAIARAERSVALNAIDLTSATLESPVDLTQFVANPDMETGDIKGWTATAGWQFQNNNQFANGDAVINNKFQERWEWNAALGNTSTMQTLLDMPNGVYGVSASIIATRQDAGNPKEAATGVYLFAGDEKVAVATENNTPELFTVRVKVENNALTLGIKGEEANANWIAFDNVKLSYLGDGEEPEEPETPEEPEEPEVDPNDYTSYIKNASVAENAEWEGGLGHGNGGLYKTSAESFDFTQTIILPAGQYKMTAQAAYRYAGSNDGPTAEEYEYTQIQAGVETHLAKLYAETSSYKYETNVQNRWEGASDTDYLPGGSSTVNGKYVPNSSNAVKAWFDNGMYVNELVFNVQEEGAVKIGIAKSTKAPNGDYTNIGAWTLTRLGDAEADPEVEEPEEPETPEEPGDETEETVPVDMTHLVGTSRDAWQGNNGGPVNIEGIAMPEKYETTTETLGDVMWQEVSGLENGKYTVELWANARYTSGRGFDSQAENGALEFTYLFANNVEISIPVYHNGDLNNNTSHVLEGVEVTDGTLRMGMTKKAAGSNWHTIQIKSLTYHAPGNAALNMAKADLMAALEAANAVSPATDEFVAAIAAAQAVYDSSNDKDEVLAATATLKEATKLAILMNATEENPVLTDFVVNGTFDSAIAPWQSTTGAQNQALASNQQGAFTGNFFENWHPSNYTGKLYQVIENIPNGIYELSICAFTNNHDASAQFVYANGDKVALTTGAPTAYTVRTIVENNTIEIGFEQTAAVSNWCGIDNISLTYFGEATNEAVLNAAKEAFTAAYDEFGVAFAACQAMMLKMSFYEIDDAAYQLNGQLETTTDIDALNAMVEALNEATASLNEINEVYAAYDVFVQKFKDAAEISEPLTTEAAELLEYNMYGGAGMQATSIEALEQATQTIKADFITYIANAKLLDGNMFDVTCLITNAAVTSAEGWTNAEGRIINNTEYTGAPDKAAFDAGWWAGVIDIHQVLPTLPAGNYVLSAVARSASPDSYLYAKSGETEVKATLPQNGDQGGELGNGWANVSTETINVVEGESLTIGVYINNPGTNFAAADNFKLYFGGLGTDPLYDLSEVREAFEAQVMEFMAFGEGSMALYKLAALKAQFEEVMMEVNTLYEAIYNEEKVLKADVEEAMELMTATKAAIDPVLAYYTETYSEVYYAADDLLQSFDTESKAYAALDEVLAQVWDLSEVTTVEELEAKVAIINEGVAALYDLSEVREAFEAQVMEFMAFGEGSMALYKLAALKAQFEEVMMEVNTLYEAIYNEEKVLKADVEEAMELMTATKAAIEPVLAYYTETYSEVYYAADDLLQSFEPESKAYAALDEVLGQVWDLSEVTTVEELEAYVAIINEGVTALYDLSDVREAFEAQAMEFMEFGQSSMALYQLSALQAKYMEVMMEVEALYGAIYSEEKVLKADVEEAMELMTTTKAAIEPVLAYYTETYSEVYYAADDLLQSFEPESKAYAALDEVLAQVWDLSEVTTVEELEAKAAIITAGVAALYDLSEVREAFVAQVMEFMAFGEGSMALYKLAALKAQFEEVMMEVNTLYEAIYNEEKVLKGDVEEAMELMTATKAEIEPVVTYYSETYSEIYYAADDKLQSLDPSSDEYAYLDEALGQVWDLSEVTTVGELEAKAAIITEAMENLANGIENIEADSELIIYDLSGRRVEKMEKGIYIVNGKKVFKK